ncbi:hypothetical protein L209DRAFT_18475 [Thermothelomyces heterothallicus CBS 203.75]
MYGCLCVPRHGERWQPYARQNVSRSEGEAPREGGWCALYMCTEYRARSVPFVFLLLFSYWRLGVLVWLNLRQREELSARGSSLASPEICPEVSPILFVLCFILFMFAAFFFSLIVIIIIIIIVIIPHSSLTDLMCMLRSMVEQESWPGMGDGLGGVPREVPRSCLGRASVLQVKRRVV